MSDAPECPHCGGNPSGSATFELSCCPLAYRDTVEAALRDAKKQIPEMVIVDVRCHHCGRGNSYPVLPQYSDPRFVQKLKYDLDRFKKEVRLMQADVKELAEECLRAGVVPERMRRLDSMLADLKAIIEWAKENDRATGAN